MQQRQPRLGDILDDYCPRERRVTNHAVVAMVGDAVKQTRCTTCDAEHEYKHAKVPRPRKKPDAAALVSAAPAGPKRIVHDTEQPHAGPPHTLGELVAAKEEAEEQAVAAAEAQAEASAAVNEDEHDDDLEVETVEEGPVHRPLIRATLPRHEGQPPPQRPAPDFTIRQPGGRAGRFRARPQRGGSPFGNRSNGNVGGHGAQGGRPPRPHHRHHDRKRSK
jgi:hypothetical protein